MITGRSYTLLPLQGEVFPVVLGYPGCRFACPGLSARWAFSPLHLMGPIVPDFFTSNWTPYQLCSNLSMSDEPRGEPSLLGLSRGENASRRKPMSACKKLHRKQEFWFLECGAKLRWVVSVTKQIQLIQPKYNQNTTKRQLGQFLYNLCTTSVQLLYNIQLITKRYVCSSLFRCYCINRFLTIASTTLYVCIYLLSFLPLHTYLQGQFFFCPDQS